MTVEIDNPDMKLDENRVIGLSQENGQVRFAYMFSTRQVRFDHEH